MAGNIVLQMDDSLPLRDVVFNALRQAILNGTLEPGERVMEIHMAHQLGVSRTPVREALRMLELEGLVLTIPRRGAVVAEITRRDLEEVLEVRLALEQLAVSRACRLMSENQMDELEKASEHFRKCLEGTDLKKSAEADVRFHDLISEATDNTRLIGLLTALRDQMYRYRLENLKDPGTYPTLIAHHEALCAAIRERNETEAVRVIRQHISSQKESVLEKLRGKRDGSP